MAPLYFALLRAQVRQIARGNRPSVLLGLGFVARMLLFGGAMALLLWWTYAAGAAYAIAFIAVRTWLIQKLRNGMPTPARPAEDSESDLG